jgi:hypothetical protein
MATTIPGAASLTELLVQANSPYNDGWTREFYREEYEKVKRQQDMVRFSQESGDYELPPHTD